MKKIFTIGFTLLTYSLFAQQICFSPQVIENQIANAANPQLVIDEINNLKNTRFIPTKSATTYKIPVVFHIIHNGDEEGTDENISDSIILQQLKRINIDFAGKNPDSINIPAEFKSIFAQADISFCLAKKDPEGNFTTGINRYEYNAESWDFNDINNTIKPETIWERSSYLNIWILKFGGTLSSNLVNGYATPPFSSTSFYEDGVVLNHLKVGNNLSSDIGRTAVHEIGHWLGLFHIWGDDSGACTGDDGIDDTPNQADSYYNCPSGTPNSCGSNDMFMNFMDYTNASCAKMFTHDQTIKMHSVINNFRDSLLISEGCKVKDLVIKDIIFPKGTICQDRILPAIAIQNIGTEAINSYGFSFYLDNVLMFTVLKNEALQAGEIAYLSAASLIEINDNNSHLARFEIATNDTNEYSLNNEQSSSFKCINTGNGYEAIALNENFESTTFPPTNMYIQNDDNSTAWAEFSGTNNKLAYFDNFGNTHFGKDALLTTDYNFFTEPTQDYKLNFDYLYSHIENKNDTLSVYLSIDCGVNWFPVWSKFGDDLSTLSSINSELIYTNQNLKTESINLKSKLLDITGFKKIRFKFENKSGMGNQIYLDNINVSFATSIEEISTSKISFYPNPVNNILNFKNVEQEYLVKLYTNQGSEIASFTIDKNNSSIALNSFTKGLYFIEITEKEKQIFTRAKLFIID